MTHSSSGRHYAGGILALLASGSLLLASCAAVTRAWTVLPPGAAAEVRREPRLSSPLAFRP